MSDDQAKRDSYPSPAVYDQLQQRAHRHHRGLEDEAAVTPAAGVVTLRSVCAAHHVRDESGAHYEGGRKKRSMSGRCREPER